MKEQGWKERHANYISELEDAVQLFTGSPKRHRRGVHLSLRI